MSAVERTTCFFCGYDLASVPDDGQCPECGQPAREARRGDAIDTAPRSHGRRLVTGALLIELGLLITLALGVIRHALAVVMTQVLGDGTGLSTWDVINQYASGGLSILILGVATIEIIGWWRLTTVDPRLARRDPATIVRHLVRITVVLAPLMSGLWLVLDWTSGPRAVLTAFVVVGAIVRIGRHVAIVLLVRSLARRAEAPTLRRWATHLLWIGPVAAIAHQVLITFMFDQVSFDRFWIVHTLSLSLSFAWTLLWIITIDWLRRAIVAAMRQAPPAPPLPAPVDGPA